MLPEKERNQDFGPMIPELPMNQFYGITQGLPGSGKSTAVKRAIETVNRYRETHNKFMAFVVEVNRDEIRQELGVGFGKAEKKVAQVRDERIREALNLGQSVICSDTNLEESTVNHHREAAEAAGVPFYVFNRFLDVPVHRCIEQDLARPESVGKDVIERMYARYWAWQPKPVNAGAKQAIIVDIDGTLAHPPPYKGRYPYDRDYRKDSLDPIVADLINRYHGHGWAGDTTVILMSGRDGSEENRQQTIEWLDKNRVAYDRLIMRPEEDHRDDSIVKKELYLNHVQGKYRVFFVLDDRPRVCRMWRHELGLPVLQVSDNIEF